jgi:hypothetical protein
MTFKDALTEDTDVFLNSEEFAEDAIFSRNGLIIKVIPSKEMEVETGRIVDVMTVRESDIIGIQPNDTLTIGTNVYKFVSKYPNMIGELMCLIRVEK